MQAALTIAGSDPSGGAGIQADLKTFHQFGVYGTSVLALVTVQNTVGVRGVTMLEASLVRDQLNAVVQDIPPAAAKSGALGTAGAIQAVAGWACTAACPLVIDPVMVSKHGARLLGPEAERALRDQLLPCATLVTPNLPEAAALTGLEVTDEESMLRAGRMLLEIGAAAVLVKGGHLAGEAVDLLVRPDSVRRYASPRVDTPHTHGTGCTYSAAITACLARGAELPEAIRIAKAYVSRAIATAPGLGRGLGPLNHFAAVDDSADFSSAGNDSARRR